jgi:hypothetical protein
MWALLITALLLKVRFWFISIALGNALKGQCDDRKRGAKKDFVVTILDIDLLKTAPVSPMIKKYSLYTS